MAFNYLFRRYSTSSDVQLANQSNKDENSIAETLLDELENQCRACSVSSALQKKSSQISLGSTNSSMLAGETIISNKRHASVDYSWLTPNKNLLHSTHEVYHLSDMIKMELSELIRNVPPEDCALIINQFRQDIHAQTKMTTPENVIAVFRKTISEYLDQKGKPRSNSYTSTLNNAAAHSKINTKTSATIYNFARNNRINPKRQADDEQHCIAELTEISISSSSADGHDNRPNLNSQQ